MAEGPLWPGLDLDVGEERLWLEWLVRLRWVAIIAQIVTLLFAFGMLESAWLMVPLLAVTAVLSAGNVHARHLLSTSSDPIEPKVLLFQLGLDVSVLTAWFVLAGGPDNPFTVLYVIHVAMAGIMLGARDAAWLTIFVLACFTLLHFAHLPLHFDRHTIPEPVLVPLGRLLAFSITSGSIGLFVVGTTHTLRAHRRRLLEAQMFTARTDRLRSVGTLAAGAAHELNTPLSTIGLRVRRVGRRHADEETVRDLDVIRAQLQRCTRVVEQLLFGAGDPAASGMERAPLAGLVGEAIRLWSKGTTLTVVVRDETESAAVELPRVAFCQGFINLLENARQAQEAIGVDQPLELSMTRRKGDIVLTLRDHGCGLPEQFERVGEPFFTTKSNGTGLGVYVARQVADGAGGGLALARGHGYTEVALWVPEAPRGANDVESTRTDGGR